MGVITPMAYRCPLTCYGATAGRVVAVPDLLYDDVQIVNLSFILLNHPSIQALACTYHAQHPVHLRDRMTIDAIRPGLGTRV